MQIVIKIPEEVYKRTLPYKNVPVISNLANDYPELTHAVSNGTPLPKGHDRLVEAREVIKAMFAGKTIDDVPTIIEADKESELNG